jgi:predicted Zn-dependent peptidase
VSNAVTIHALKNGLTVIVEEMPHVESAAYDLLIPGGIITDGQATIGESLILAELTSRGAGQRDARGLMEAFDDIGARHGESASHDRFMYSGSLIADVLPRALELVSDMVQRPTLPEQEIDPIRSVFLQDIASIGDNPARKAMMELAERYYPAPFNRPSTGTEAGLHNVTHDSIRSRCAHVLRPHGAILSIAGNVKTAQLLSRIEELLSSWSGTGDSLPQFGSVQKPEVYHVQQESSQLQIVLAFPSAVFGDQDYYAAKVIGGILSGGMFGRLFIEVREKRGLVYSVYARHSATTHYGTMSVYAGTTPERAAETLQVIEHELNSLAGTITEEELARAKANLKASVIMGDESSGARASSNASDYWLVKRVRPLSEIQEAIDSVSRDQIARCMQRFSPTAYSLLTLGSRHLIEPGPRVVE